MYLGTSLLNRTSEFKHPRYQLKVRSEKGNCADKWLGVETYQGDILTSLSLAYPGLDSKAEILEALVVYLEIISWLQCLWSLKISFYYYHYF